ncbi:MAG: ABC transporter ATP-binding protein [Anaerolineales bacterium]|nr:ABC transporter ATP-binding protein [Anaerolineales bacterium]
MIVTKGLSKNFEDFQAVVDVNLHVKRGKVLALLGPNGAGKTTTVRMLTSVLRPTRGEAAIAGYDVTEYPNEVRASVGVLTEQHGLYNRMPAAEYLDFFGQIYGMDRASREKRTAQLLAQYGLAEAGKKRVGEFSKGMRQKLALARALYHDPPVLLLDEPTSAMDPESSRLVRDAIKDLRIAERAMIICTHNLAEAEDLADHIAIIRRGRIIVSGTPEKLKQHLLGPAEYEVRFSEMLNGNKPVLPEEAILIGQDGDRLRFSSQDPQAINPQVLSGLLSQGLSVVSLQEVPRSLEQVYLQAVSAPESEVTADVG